MLSIWEQNSFYQPTDIAIIGGGLTGLITAIYCKQKSPSTSVRVLEQSPYPAGASVKNAGFACFGSVSEILDDIESESETKALDRVVLRYEGLQMLRELTADHPIGWRADGGYEVFTESEKSIYQKSLDAFPSLNQKLGKPLGFEPFAEISNPYGFNSLPRLIGINGEASLNSGALMRALLKIAADHQVEITMGCPVQELEKTGNHWMLKTARAQIKAEQVVVATNGFTGRLLPQLPLLPYRGQVLLTDPIDDLRMTGNFHLNQGYYYFRPYENGILLGGGRQLDKQNEQTDAQHTTKIIQEALEKLLREVIIPEKNYHIKQRWAGTMAFGPGNEKEPLIQEVESGLLAGARLGGMGVAMAPQVARKLTKMLF